MRNVWMGLCALALAACGSDGGSGATDARPADAARTTDARPADAARTTDARPADAASPADAARAADATSLPDAQGPVDAVVRDAVPGDATAEAGIPANADAAPPDAAATAYCDCMLVTCHETYHATWGEDEDEARRNCLHGAATLPRNDGPIDHGDWLECRQHFCDAAVADESACAAAAGNETCR